MDKDKRLQQAIKRWRSAEDFYRRKEKETQDAFNAALKARIEITDIDPSYFSSMVKDVIRALNEQNGKGNEVCD